jgi:hypothetical protein
MTTLYINTAAELYALMTSTSNLNKTIIQTANIDMSGFTSESIAHNVGPTLYDFSGIYDGQGYTITIRDVVGSYTGLFDSLAKPAGEGGIVKNINLIYQNPISQTLSSDAWGGLVGGMTVSSIQNCSVTINAPLSIVLDIINTNIGAICGFMGQNSLITNTQLIINNTIELEGRNGSSVGLICGQNENSGITNCSVISAMTEFDISLKSGPSNSSVGLICGEAIDNFTALDIPDLENITINLNNDGQIILDAIAGQDTIKLGAFCGILTGDISTGPNILNCTININNNQELVGQFNDFFGQVTGVTIISQCQFNYTTTTANTTYIGTISPVPPVNTPLIYTNSISNVYNLASSSNYYISNTNAIVVLGNVSITLESQTSPAGIIINGMLQPVGTTYSASTPNYEYTVIVKGVGSMYFGFNYIGISDNIIDTPEECICQVNSCATNPQTGISENSRITNIKEDKAIRVNVDKEFATKSVIYPKFKSYSDYMKYLQAGLKY